MPTYQYACTACGEPHEAVQSFTDAPLTECPACQGRLRKVYSAVGVVFKGSGFYKNDSRKARTSEGDSGKSDSGKGDAAAAKTDSPAAKTDSPKKESAPAKSDSSSGGGGAKTPAAKTA